MADAPDTPGKRLLRSVLTRGVEILARAVAKGAESAVDDVGKLVEDKRRKIQDWRQDNLGEIDVTAEEQRPASR